MSDSITPYNLDKTLSKAAESLTEKNVRDIAFLCENITGEERKRIKTADDLLRMLQAKCMISENDVTQLIDLLEVLKIKKPLEELKRYRRERNNEMGILNSPDEHCEIHSKKTIYFCIECSKSLCSECAFRLHAKQRCEVIELQNVQPETEAREQNITEKLRILQDKLSEANASLGHCQKNARERASQLRNQITKDYSSFCRQIEQKCSELLDKIADMELVDVQQLNMFEEQTKEASEYVSTFNKYLISDSPNAVSELEEVQIINERVSKILQRLEEANASIDETFSGLCYISLANDAKFGSISRP